MRGVGELADSMPLTLTLSPLRGERGLKTWLLLSALVCACGGAFAHAPVASEVRTTLDPLPETLTGLRIQLHETLAPQLVIENPTDKALEVLDAKGRAFLRIGPASVQADMAALAWYKSFVPGGVPAPLEAADEHASARWVRISGSSSWGWFDPRLRTETQPTKTQRHGGDAVKLGVWRVPLRYDGKPGEITGAFIFEPPPVGHFEPRLTSAAEPAAGLRVKLIPGMPSALLLENNTKQTITVLGAAGEPMLRLKEKRIYANLRSASWRASGRSFTTAAAQAEAAPKEELVLWTLVARGNRYSWLEPRAGMSQRGERTSGDWEVPLLIDQHQVMIKGTLEWVPNAK